MYQNNFSILYDLAEWRNGLAFKDIDFSSHGKPIIKIAELKNGITEQTKFTKQQFDSSVALIKNDMVFSWSGNPETSIDIFYYNLADGWLNQHIFKVTPKINKKYFYYLMKSLRPYFISIASQKQTTGLGHITVKDLKNFKVKLHNNNYQQHIVNLLGSIDDKIENNEKIIEKLEKLFSYECGHFFNKAEGCCQGSLLDIAEFTNGLPMQKYRSKSSSYLQVLKIKELNQGYCDSNSDLCDDEIQSDFIVENGDIVFSWSGTLLVKIWGGRKCGLNQHLYKVTSKTSPKWLFYYWTTYHLKEFQNIASGKATTMGHIKREDLKKAKVLIPEDAKSDYYFDEILNKIINTNRENYKLKNLKQLYLQKFFN